MFFLKTTNNAIALAYAVFKVVLKILIYFYINSVFYNNFCLAEVALKKLYSILKSQDNIILFIFGLMIESSIFF
ncbi:MAG: hypothetical protein D6B28_07210 [Gammaproteobacteria bacterium]|nr:MAG: hypothetical protein D6B28_07210 [Gammaproteobacteria bacterium]